MKHKYLANVTTLKCHEEKCSGCERCTEVCPHGVFDIIDNKAQIIDKDLCMECGACVMNCPAKAIAWVEDEEEAFGARIEVDEDKCTGCGICAPLCCSACIELK